MLSFKLNCRQEVHSSFHTNDTTYALKASKPDPDLTAALPPRSRKKAQKHKSLPETPLKTQLNELKECNALMQTLHVWMCCLHEWGSLINFYWEIPVCLFTKFGCEFPSRPYTSGAAVIPRCPFTVSLSLRSCHACVPLGHTHCNKHCFCSFIVCILEWPLWEKITKAQSRVYHLQGLISTSTSESPRSRDARILQEFQILMSIFLLKCGCDCSCSAAVSQALGKTVCAL